MAIKQNPNFPSGLDIHPLGSAVSDSDARFDSVAQEDAIKTYGIAGRIWEASHAMLAYLDPSSPLEFDPPPPTFASTARRPITAIELGSGTGFVAASVAEWLRPECDLLIATDLPDVCTLLEMNLRASPTVWVLPLAWGSEDHVRSISGQLGLSRRGSHTRQLTHILCSDLIYFPALLAPLLRSLIHLTSAPFVDDTSPEPPLVLLSYKMRSLSKETPFWSAFGLWFEFVPVLARRPSTKGGENASWSRFSPGDASDETFVLVARRRPESLQWTVPENDSALLSGVGACFSESPKSDDQFERLLLMGMDIS
ncbi:putative methyltransferase-domain-containing protein [Cubamyces menziesii]|uniref:Methyltransferase-domain-containing protein n=1 Tax=Trametes cubensis TaxID=1111947 RepID=A0AAD7TP32_9APHY|nr:putative methyltransferase-domain-containing protein [Cubamyces menziesii]KAJ8473213.1 hypothetical protein ONZ51_g8009 [Trametes cubensis]